MSTRNIIQALQGAAGSAGAEVLDVDNVFRTHLYAGDGNNAREINNGIDLSGEGGMVWFKARSTAQNHRIFDTERGSDYSLITNSNAAQADHGSGGLNSFDDDGFTLGNAVVNGSGIYGGDYVSWTFRKAPKFFDIVTYTGDGNSSKTINHNLGTTVGMLIVKCTSHSQYWHVLHRSGYNSKTLYLNTSSAETNDTTAWNSTSPTSTQFTVGSALNISGRTYVAYLFAHHDQNGTFGPNSDQDIIHCGSYDGSNSAQEINVGFEPQFILQKRLNSTSPWRLHDISRGMPFEYKDAYLSADENSVEGYYDIFSPTPTGFRIDHSAPYYNTSGGSYMYMAIRRGPLTEPENASDVFSANTGGSNIYDLGFVPDFNINAQRSSSSQQNYALTRLLGDTELRTNRDIANSGEMQAYQIHFWDCPTNSIDINSAWWGSTTGIISWSWKRAPGYFDVRTYIGSGNSVTKLHSLSAVPEMIWVKQVGQASDWMVYHSGLGNTKVMRLNSTIAAYTDSKWNNTTPTSTVFSVDSSNQVNGSGRTYVAWLFASLAGISKVGSYSGNGSSQTIDCGFSNGAKFVLIKRTTDLGNWHVWDTARGIVAGNDPFRELDTTNAENSSYDSIDPDNSGFIVNNTINTLINASGSTYIFYAIAA